MPDSDADSLPRSDDVKGWLAWCTARFDDVDEAADHDPLANRVRETAFSLAEHLRAGVIEPDTLTRLIKTIGDEAALARANRFRAAHAMGDGDTIDHVVRRALDPLAGQDFEAVRPALERTIAGIVFTAHPTFANPVALREAMGAFAATGDEVAFRQSIAELGHAPGDDITLYDEHHEVLDRLAQARRAISKTLIALIGWARDHYPDHWRTLAPEPISLATWVGYDLDGRTDIHWAQTFYIRLTEKARQLAAYAGRLHAIAGDDDDLKAIGEQLSRAGALADRQAAAFDADLDDPDVVVTAANLLTGDDPDRLITLDEIQDRLGAAIIAADDDDRASALMVLRSEMQLYGLGEARIHLRVNAAQVRSTLKTDLGLDADTGFADRTALVAAAHKSKITEPRRINFASVFNEKMTARRQLMLCAQFIKHVDAKTPIRFLIAECEAPATIMGAVYLARLYDVDQRVDISPLFETPEALERGGRFLEKLLHEPEFVTYIRARGRIAIQLGFSDSGRFMGQVPADLAIERLHVLLAREMANRGIRDVEVVVFNTHGESMGRGGYPGDMTARFDHLLTPWTRARYEREGIAVNPESSFQGGDGFLHFQNETIAEKTVAALFAWGADNRRFEADDRFYHDINFSWDIYRSIKSWQESLFSNPAYQEALGGFARHFLLKTGSRKTRRQSGASATDAARSLRAIPHNAILQQLAAPANVFGGMGAAAAREPGRFESLLAGSTRMRSQYGLARQARAMTALSVFRSYGALYSAEFWTIFARHTQKRSTAGLCLDISHALNARETATSLTRLANLLSEDRLYLDRVERDRADKTPVLPMDDNLYTLHAIRIALMTEAFLLTASVPAFSARHEMTRRSILDLALDLELTRVCDLLEQIFPVAASGEAAFEGLNERADESEPVRGYPEIHRDIIHPLQGIARQLNEISAVVAHFYNAYG